jgi:hypothetical protein
LNFKLRDSPFGGSEKYQPAYGNKLALLERRRQAGYEPNSNMDWIVMAALTGFSLLLLTISYDIASQWKCHFEDRIKKLPEDMRLPEDVKVQCALPVWHAGSHNEPCQNENSLSFKVGVGKSDGEGVERL